MSTSKKPRSGIDDSERRRTKVLLKELLREWSILKKELAALLAQLDAILERLKAVETKSL